MRLAKKGQVLVRDETGGNRTANAKKPPRPPMIWHLCGPGQATARHVRNRVGSVAPGG